MPVVQLAALIPEGCSRVRDGLYVCAERSGYILGGFSITPPSGTARFYIGPPIRSAV